MANILHVKELSVAYDKSHPPVLQNISIRLKRGEILGVVGESGCGKTTLGKAIIGELPQSGTVESGSIEFAGREITQLTKKNRRAIQGTGLGIITQESLSSLNPVRKIGVQFTSLLRERLAVSKQQARCIAEEYMERVHCTKEMMKRFPFQLSGGQRQRVILAMAFALKPKLLIADEPTTALDVTIQKQILKELLMLKEDSQTGIILISHDLGVISQICDKTAVMYKGKIVEYGKTETILTTPQHPYTIGLIKSIPTIDHDRRERLFHMPMSEGKDLKGCPFVDRCFMRFDQCTVVEPKLKMKEKGVYTACLK